MNMRAWDEQHCVMHYDFQYIKSGDTGADWIIFTSDKHGLDSRPHPFENPFFAKQLKIMRGIDHKDKRGKFIYEGDIVRTDEGGWIAQVTWNGDAFMCEGTGFSSQCNWKAFEILGNAFENPELVKKYITNELVERPWVDKPPAA